MNLNQFLLAITKDRDQDRFRMGQVANVGHTSNGFSVDFQNDIPDLQVFLALTGRSKFTRDENRTGNRADTLRNLRNATCSRRRETEIHSTCELHMLEFPSTASFLQFLTCLKCLND